MQTAEIKRFFDYVQLTTRPGAAAERRQAMSAALTGHTCRTHRELVRTVHGNTKDLAWVSRAIAAGRIEQRADGVLCLPDARREAPAPPPLAEWYDAFLDLCEQCPDADLKNRLDCAVDAWQESRDLDEDDYQD